jgi:abortive infection bacteriophage resistance protein
MKEATTVDEQIARFRERGMLLDDSEEKIKEELLDIGYFRLGFYCFPFEKSYPDRKNRNHQYKEGTRFSNVIKLYYLDANLRNILLKYIYRIEINLRTKVVYIVSNKHKSYPAWFVEPSVMSDKYIKEFDTKVYTEAFKKNNKMIKWHHNNHNDDKYAPAWKTLEYMTFGSIPALIENIGDENTKKEIANVYNISSVTVFLSYIRSIVFIRNICAHGGVLFDINLPQSIAKGPALKINESNKNILYSVIRIMLFILEKISKNRATDMKKEVNCLFDKHKDNEAIRNIIETRIGYQC